MGAGLHLVFRTSFRISWRWIKS